MWTIDNIYHDSFHHISPNIFEGRKLCVSCKIAVRKASGHSSGGQDQVLSEHGSTATLPSETSVANLVDDASSMIEDVNKTLQTLGQSPTTRWQLSRSRTYKNRKYKDAAKSLQESFNSLPGTTLEDDDVDIEIDSKDFEEAGREMINQLKEKFSSTTLLSGKVQVLSVLPKYWSIRRIQNEFGCSKRLVQVVKKTVAEKGILCTANPKQGKPLASETTKAVVSFYNEQDISKELPGKKDFKSVKVGNTREHRQKKLILGNLKEIYKTFKERFPQYKIGFSTFAELRPPECVLAGAPG